MQIKLKKDAGLAEKLPDDEDPERSLRGDLLPHQLRNARHRYSLSRAVRKLAGLRSVGDQLDGLEGEVSQELGRRSGRHVRSGAREGGMFVPWDAPIHSRSLSTSTGAGGIPTILGRPLIDVLRARALVGQLGARILPDVRGGMFAYPQRTATAAVSWVDEAQPAPSQTNQTIGNQVLFTPHTATAFTDMTIRASVSIPDSEGLVEDDLTRALAVEVDRIACNGRGVSGEPLGILQNSAVATIPFSDPNGGAPTWPIVCQLRRALGRGNADVGSLGWLTTPDAEYKLRTTEKTTGTGRFIWTERGTVAGAPAFGTNQLPSNVTKGTGTNLSSGIFGNWEDAMLAFWGPLEVLVNPFKFSTDGVIRITALVDVDFQLAHNASFCKFVDMITS